MKILKKPDRPSGESFLEMLALIQMKEKFERTLQGFVTKTIHKHKLTHSSLGEDSKHRVGLVNYKEVIRKNIQGGRSYAISSEYKYPIIGCPTLFEQ